MDYKELAERLKYYGTTYAIGDNLGREITGTDELMLNAAESITELLTENQVLRNAANSFKKQAEAAEARAEKAERDRDIAVEQLHHCENNCDYCRNRCECDKEICFSPSPITGEPTDCWKWCGLEE